MVTILQMLLVVAAVACGLIAVESTGVRQFYNRTPGQILTHIRKHGNPPRSWVSTLFACLCILCMIILVKIS